jgi:hypothetical protein
VVKYDNLRGLEKSAFEVENNDVSEKFDKDGNRLQIEVYYQNSHPILYWIAGLIFGVVFILPIGGILWLGLQSVLSHLL